MFRGREAGPRAVFKHSTREGFDSRPGQEGEAFASALRNSGRSRHTDIADVISPAIPCDMMRFLLRFAAIWSLSAATHASIIPPVTEGVWRAEKVLPSAIESGDFSQIQKLLSSNAVIVSDDEKVLAKGPEEIVKYLSQWYAKDNHVSNLFPGYASIIVLVTRETDRPWKKAYAMVVTCNDAKIARIMMIPRNPNMK